jgi:hypothetical protein
MRAQFLGLAVLSLVILLGVACSDDDSDNGTDPDVVTVSDLAGTWTATKWVFEDPNSDQEVDMMSLGFDVSFVAESNGRYTLTIVFQEQVQEVDTGTFSIDGNVLIADSDDDDENVFFSFTLDGDTFEVMDPSEEFDFDDDGVDEPATLRITFIRS